MHPTQGNFSMRKSIRLSVIASLLMGSGVALAAVMEGNSHSASLSATRIYTVPTDSSLYQLALQSGISVVELRKLNKGSLDRRDRLNTGESLLLPINSPLFPAEDTSGVIASDLPELGMGNAPLPKDGVSAAEMKTAGAAQFVGAQNWNTMTGEQVKSQAEGWAKNQAKNQVVAPVQREAQDFLGSSVRHRSILLSMIEAASRGVAVRCSAPGMKLTTCWRFLRSASTVRMAAPSVTRGAGFVLNKATGCGAITPSSIRISAAATPEAAWGQSCGVTT